MATELAINLKEVICSEYAPQEAKITDAQPVEAVKDIVPAAEDVKQEEDEEPQPPSTGPSSSNGGDPTDEPDVEMTDVAKEEPPIPTAQVVEKEKEVGTAVGVGGGRTKRASAIRADAMLNGWHQEEELAFIELVGKDIFLPANSPARTRKHGTSSVSLNTRQKSRTPPPTRRAAAKKEKRSHAITPTPKLAPGELAKLLKKEEEKDAQEKQKQGKGKEKEQVGKKRRGPSSAPLASASSPAGARRTPPKKARTCTVISANASEINEEGPAPVDALYGCGKCRYSKLGCIMCRDRPAFTRPHLRWQPQNGHPQDDIPTLKPFRPTAEEFKDPIAYISKIMPEASKYGLAHIIPPEGWEPPFALERGTNGVNMESFRFSIRKQLTSHLCYRNAPQPRPENTDAPAAPVAESRYGGRKLSQSQQPQQPLPAAQEPVEEQKQAIDGLAAPPTEKVIAENQGKQATPAAVEPPRALTAADVRAALAAVSKLGSTPAAAPGAPTTSNKQIKNAEPAAAAVDAPAKVGKAAAEEKAAAAEPEEDPSADFGFPTLDKKYTLRSFAAYADWVKAVHFSSPPATGSGDAPSATCPSDEEENANDDDNNNNDTTRLATSTAPTKRPLKTLPLFYAPPVEPTVAEVEAEFWRIVETPHSHFESLYGQDLDSGHHGSGFPLPEWRRRLLEEHLAAYRRANGSITIGEEVHLPDHATETEKEYAEHAWNINNMPRSKASMLRYLLGDGLITGVMVPWLYVGSCLSAFCWHVEDHALYSVNYHHLGAPKVWYGVPARATAALEEAMRDALPHLFDASPNLLYQLVTLLSPKELKARGVPAYRVIHEAGSFVITMPDAYHAGFNTGFNCAEAVNFAAPQWIPFGTDVAQKYRDSGKPATMSHDSLLVALAIAAQHVPSTRGQDGGGGDEGVSLGGEEAEEENAAAEDDGNKVDEAEKLPNNAQQATGFGPLGDIPWQDAPLEGILLGTGELALRAEEEQKRWAAGMAALSSLGIESLPRCPVDASADPGTRDPATGMLVNTAESDCCECSGDLWLAAVVSSDAPKIAVCVEHASALINKHGCAPDSLRLLCRHSPDDLQALVDAAVVRIEGAAEAVAEARKRREENERARVRAVPVGPLYPTENGEYHVVPIAGDCRGDQVEKHHPHTAAADSAGGGTGEGTEGTKGAALKGNRERELEEEEVLPVKRRRGRPPKLQEKNEPEKAPPKPRISKQPQPAKPAAAAQSIPSEPPVLSLAHKGKKKRGRPSKAEMAARMQRASRAMDPEEAQAQEEWEDEMEEMVLLKARARRRGGAAAAAAAAAAAPAVNQNDTEMETALCLEEKAAAPAVAAAVPVPVEAEEREDSLPEDAAPMPAAAPAAVAEQPTAAGVPLEAVPVTVASVAQQPMETDLRIPLFPDPSFYEFSPMEDDDIDNDNDNDDLFGDQPDLPSELSEDVSLFESECVDVGGSSAPAPVSAPSEVHANGQMMPAEPPAAVVPVALQHTAASVPELSDDVPREPDDSLGGTKEMDAFAAVVAAAAPLPLVSEVPLPTTEDASLLPVEMPLEQVVSDVLGSMIQELEQNMENDFI